MRFILLSLIVLLSSCSKEDIDPDQDHYVFYEFNTGSCPSRIEFYDHDNNRMEVTNITVPQRVPDNVRVGDTIRLSMYIKGCPGSSPQNLRVTYKDRVIFESSEPSGTYGDKLFEINEVFRL